LSANFQPRITYEIKPEIFDEKRGNAALLIKNFGFYFIFNLQEPASYRSCDDNYKCGKGTGFLKPGDRSTPFRLLYPNEPNINLKFFLKREKRNFHLCKKLD